MHKAFARIGPLHCLAIYFLGLLLLFPQLKWYLDSPDAFHYLALAHRWAEGELQHVANGYWSPLIIWWTVAFIKLPVSDLVAAKLAQASMGAIGVYVWYRLVERNSLPAKGLAALAAVPFMWVYTFLNFSGDLSFLVVSLLILLLSLQRPFNSVRSAVIFGITGGLWYFSKAFGLPMFIAWSAFLFLSQRKGSAAQGTPPMLRNWIIALCTAAVLVSPWIFTISQRYGHFTISEAARYNLTLEVAPTPEGQPLLPGIAGGLIAPEPPAVSAWEEPGEYVRLTPLVPWQHTDRYLSLLHRNLLTIHYHDVRRQIGSILLVLLLILLVKSGWRRPWSDRSLSCPLLFMVILNAGYSLILVHDRYIWINTFIMLLVIGRILYLLLPKQAMLRDLAMLCVLLLAVKRPVKELLYSEDKNVSARQLITDVGRPFKTMEKTYATDKAFGHTMAGFSAMGPEGPVASLRTEGSERVTYTRTLHLAYASGLPYHGELEPEADREIQLLQLKEHAIRYLVLYEDAPSFQGDTMLTSAYPALTILRLY